MTVSHDEQSEDELQWGDHNVFDTAKNYCSKNQRDMAPQRFPEVLVKHSVQYWRIEISDKPWLIPYVWLAIVNQFISSTAYRRPEQW